MALRGVDFAANAGEVVAVVGPSGSGKTTLLYCLAGLEPATAGQIRLFGADLGTLTGDRQADLRSQHVGFVFQRFNLIGSLDAEANAMLPAQMAGKRVDRDAAAAAFAQVGLRGRARFLPRELSGGEQQRVALARVFLARPAIVFADEPTGSLDTRTGREVMDLLVKTAQDGACVVMVTHDLDLAALADRVVILVDGSIHAHLSAPSPAQLLDAFQQVDR
jgi:putative ABC transport system ATP-binding protein